MLLIGAGGLGSPASLYLAAAGVGTLGIVDDDVVDESNLQRQIVHSTDDARRAEGRVGASARSRRSTRTSRSYRTSERLTSENVDRILGRRLGRDRRRRRQLPDALPRERRVGLARHPGRPRLDLPLRGPGHRVQAARRARATAASSRSRRRRSWRRAAPRAACSASCRGSSARSRRTRRSSSRSASASRSSAGCCSSTRSRPSFTEVQLRRDPNCPVCGEHPTITEYIDYVEFCARRGGALMASVRIPPTLRTERAASARSRPRAAPSRELLDDLATRFPALARADLRGRRDRAVRQRLRRRRGRPHARRPRHAGRRERDRRSSCPRWPAG